MKFYKLKKIVGDIDSDLLDADELEVTFKEDGILLEDDKATHFYKVDWEGEED